MHPRGMVEPPVLARRKQQIMLEYEEVISERTGTARWGTVSRLLELSDNVIRVSPSYRFLLVASDPDDNKFADCAVSAEADYIVTDDYHFGSMRGSGFKPQIITPAEFMALL